MMRQTLLLWDATCSCDSRFVGRITTITLVGMADGLNSGAGTSHCPSDVVGRMAGGLNSGAGTSNCPSDVAGRGRVHSRSSTVCNSAVIRESRKCAEKRKTSMGSHRSVIDWGIGCDKRTRQQQPLQRQDSGGHSRTQRLWLGHRSRFCAFPPPGYNA